MKVPFSVEQFLETLKSYNVFVWPIQVVLNLLALCLVIIAIRKMKSSDNIISISLAFLWIWMGTLYHIIFFAPINPAAYVFGSLFIVQGLLFLYAAFAHKITFSFHADIYGITGGIFIIYALVVYPILGYLQGRTYPFSPTFGLPCPTTIFTFGILLWTEKRFPVGLFIIPILWSFIGFSASIKLGIKEDVALLATGILFTILIIVRNRMLHKKQLSIVTPA